MTCSSCTVSGLVDTDLSLTLPSGKATVLVKGPSANGKFAGDYPLGTEVCLEEIPWAPDLSKHRQAVLSAVVAIHIRGGHPHLNRVRLTFRGIEYRGFSPKDVNVYQGSNVFDDTTWTAVPRAQRLEDVNGNAVGSTVLLAHGNLIVLTAKT